ncbi:peptidase M15 [Terrimicrobium sacchariphilum]|uniref:Peptidase M15 n=1 Tax=Terrimicrobium sacchariphilum TaxID=690879 RepID=A0A146G2I2_TERSA|nr:D-Ala-D-Ala carboxypeptidase family metallohydrolase [Terrimicrobium sacchariphilum]GAT31703.1 peptidase M15 [Terrimicrobium sacchariphilum]
MPDEDPASSAPEPLRRPVCRRRFVALLGLAGAGLAVSRYSDQLPGAWSRLREYLDSLSLAINDEVEPYNDAEADAYAIFLATANLKHVPIPVILRPHRNVHGTVRNSIPPQPLWRNILPTLRLADRLAGEMGEKIAMNSVYRSPAYNATCPGAVPSSQHTRNRAIDLSLQSSPRAVARVARQLRDRNVFCGGIGLYTSFVHIDTRGRNADWCGSGVKDA